MGLRKPKRHWLGIASKKRHPHAFLRRKEHPRCLDDVAPPFGKGEVGRYAHVACVKNMDPCYSHLRKLLS